MSLKLVKPGMEYEQSYRAYVHELGDEKRYPFPMGFDCSNFQALIQRLENFQNGIDIPEGFVPSTTYWLVQGNELLGVSNLRHCLNERIRHIGGHIGLGIRPAQRGRGLGKELLKRTIEEAVKKGIAPIHLHCHKHNQPSARMIVANGGLLESELQEVSGEVVQRYVVQRYVVQVTY